MDLSSPTALATRRGERVQVKSPDLRLNTRPLVYKKIEYKVILTPFKHLLSQEILPIMYIRGATAGYLYHGS